MRQNKIKKYFKLLLRYKTPVLLILAILPLYGILYKIYMPRVNAFGCFDDCFNIVAGYFVNKGKTLYVDIPYNHQFFMAYISFLIQKFSHPINIYELTLRHRQFVFFFGFLFNVLLIWRFRLAGFGFAVFYEFSKFYQFGDRFLAEGIIVYPLVYMIGLAWCTLQKKRIYPIEYIICASFSWFIIFMREPYTIIGLLLFTYIALRKPFNKYKILSLIFFTVLSLITIISLPLSDYIYNVYTINIQGVLGSEVESNKLFSLGLLKVFFYPIYILLGNTWNTFRVLLLSIDLLFLLLLVLYIRYTKNSKTIIISLIFLGLSNFRFVSPGKMYYEAFHMLPWYATFLFFTFLLLNDLFSLNKKMAIIFSLISIGIFCYLVFSPSSFIREKPDPHYDYIVNYGNYQQVGEVVKTLSRSNDTFFVDGYDELLHWQADRPSPYRYSWYTAFMPGIPKYLDERIYMFKHTPPDFYYGSCPKEGNASRLLPAFVRKKYIQLYTNKQPSCLYIYTAQLSQITEEQWQKAGESLYDLPSSY